MKLLTSTQKIVKKALNNKILSSRKKQILFTGLAVLIIIILILLFSLSGGGENTLRKEWAVAQRGDFTVDLVESGEIEAVSQKLVSAPMMWASRLQVIDLVPEGTVVKKGDFLLQFDVSDLQTSLDLAKDNLESLKADLRKLQAQQSLSMSNLENSLKLSQYSYEQANLRLEMSKFESKAQQEETRLQLEQARIDLERTKKQLESQKIIHHSQLVNMETSIRQAENRVKTIQERINKLCLIAPADGMVVYQEVGRWTSRERLKKGYTARPGEALISIPDLSKMEVKLYINEVDRLKVKVGQSVQITLDAYPDAEFKGKIREVFRLAQSVRWDSGLKGFAVYIDIEGTDPRLKPGMTAKVRIILDKLKDVVYVSVGTVFEVQGSPVVFPKGKTKPYAVYIGPRNDSFVVIKRGVRPGMKLSWVDPTGKAFMLGTAEEKKRIEKLNRTIRESFAVFQKRGLLYNYEGTNISKSKKSKIDINKLPSFIKKRLKNEKGEEKSKSKIKEPIMEKQQ